ncbi:MAG: hypothetical protein ABIS45_12425 [Burkholderiales bacterium]
MTITAHLRGGPADGEQMPVEDDARSILIHIIDGQVARTGAPPPALYVEFVYVRRTAVVNGAAIFEPETALPQ